MHGGKREGSGRPALWEKSYTTTPMRIPEELKAAIISARENKIPVPQIIKALEEVPMQSSIEAAKNMNYSIKNAASSAKRNAAARQSFSRFTGMVGDGLSKAFHTASPIDFGVNLWNAAGRLPEAMHQYDRNYADRVRSDIAATKAKADAYSQKVSAPKQDYSKYDAPILQPIRLKLKSFPLLP